MAPLDHIFDNHHFVYGSWCHKKKELDSGDLLLPLVDGKEERNRRMHYWSMVENTELYQAMVAKYDQYISKKVLTTLPKLF